MSWADSHIEKLRSGETVQFRPSGNSMTGRIENKQLVTVEPCGTEDAEVDDIVLCRVAGRVLVHLVTAKRSGSVQISNNKGHVNGWTKTVYGKVIRVEK